MPHYETLPATLADTLRVIPGLTTEARTVLLALPERDYETDAYMRPGGTWVLWIRQRGTDPRYANRWSVPAWNAYVAGEHSRDVEHLCQCYPCQDARFEER